MHHAGPSLLPGRPSRYGGAKTNQPSALWASSEEPLRDKTQQKQQILGPPPARQLRSPFFLPQPLNLSAARGTKLFRRCLNPYLKREAQAEQGRRPGCRAPPVPPSWHGAGGAERGRPGLWPGFPVSMAVAERPASPRLFLLLAPAVNVFFTYGCTCLRCRDRHSEPRNGDRSPTPQHSATRPEGLLSDRGYRFSAENDGRPPAPSALTGPNQAHLCPRCQRRPRLHLSCAAGEPSSSQALLVSHSSIEGHRKKRKAFRNERPKKSTKHLIYKMLRLNYFCCGSLKTKQVNVIKTKHGRVDDKGYQLKEGYLLHYIWACGHKNRSMRK